jgi:hypothetical protein
MRFGIGGGNRILRGGVNVGRGGVRGGVGVGPFSFSGGGGGGFLAGLFELLFYVVMIGAWVLFPLWPIALYLVFACAALLSPVWIFVASAPAGLLILAAVGLAGQYIPNSWWLSEAARWVSRHRKTLLLFPLVAVPVTVLTYVIISRLGFAEEWRAVDRGGAVAIFVVLHIGGFVTFAYMKRTGGITWVDLAMSRRDSLTIFRSWYFSVPKRLHPRVIAQTYSIWHGQENLRGAFRHSVKVYSEAFFTRY